MATYKIRVIQEFFVDAPSPEDAEMDAQVFMNYIQDADNVNPAPFARDFADWEISEVEE